MYTAEDFEKLEEEMKEEKGEEKEEKEEVVEGEEKEEEGKEKAEKKEDEPLRFADDSGALAGMTMPEAAAAFAQLSAGAQGLAAKARQTLEPDPPKEPEPLSADDLLDPVTIQTKLDAMVTAKMAPLEAQVTQANAVAAYQQALAASDVLTMYRPEVDAFAGQLSFEQAADPRTWQAVENHLWKTRGQQIVAARTKVKPKPTLTETGKSTEGKTKSSGAKLSTQEKFIADQLGVSHKEYAALKPDFGGGFSAQRFDERYGELFGGPIDDYLYFVTSADERIIPSEMKRRAIILNY